MDLDKSLETNKENFEKLYTAEDGYLKYPADFVIRFYHMFLKSRLPNGGVMLDYGCGSANNSLIFMDRGFEVHGVDVAPSFRSWVGGNLKRWGLPESNLDRFRLIDPNEVTLDYPDDTFDFILSNQVLYYLSSMEHLEKVVAELNRVLKPGGFVFLTMMGVQNYYITHHLKQVHDKRLYEVAIEEPGHRLEGDHETVLIVKDTEELKAMFAPFNPLSVGYFDQSLFDLYSNFHHIFVGESKK